MQEQGEIEKKNRPILLHNPADGVDTVWMESTTASLRLTSKVIAV